MNFQFGHTLIRTSFESVLDQLRKELVREGFVISGITEFQKLHLPTGSSTRQYNVLTVYHALLHKEMLTITSTEGLILPCLISVVETYPGEIMVVPINTTEIAGAGSQNSLLQALAAEVTKRIGVVIHALERKQAGDPDLVTSWG